MTSINSITSSISSLSIADTSTYGPSVTGSVSPATSTNAAVDFIAEPIRCRSIDEADLFEIEKADLQLRALETLDFVSGVEGVETIELEDSPKGYISSITSSISSLSIADTSIYGPSVTGSVSPATSTTATVASISGRQSDRIVPRGYVVEEHIGRHTIEEVVLAYEAALANDEAALEKQLKAKLHRIDICKVSKIAEKTTDERLRNLLEKVFMYINEHESSMDVSAR
jgi:hypothetical protein